MKSKHDIGKSIAIVINQIAYEEIITVKEVRDKLSKVFSEDELEGLDYYMEYHSLIYYIEEFIKRMNILKATTEDIVFALVISKLPIKVEHYEYDME